MKYNDIKIITKEESGSEPVSLAEAKAHLYITSTDHDTYLPTLIKACRKEIEGIYNVSLIDKTITAKVRYEVPGLELPYGPVVAISSILDIDGEDIDFDADNLVLDHYFDYGVVEYETEAETREDLKMKILELISYKFFNRGDTAKPTHKASWLI